MTQWEVKLNMRQGTTVTELKQKATTHRDKNNIQVDIERHGRIL